MSSVTAAGLNLRARLKAVAPRSAIRHFEAASVAGVQQRPREAQVVVDDQQHFVVGLE